MTGATVATWSRVKMLILSNNIRHFTETMNHVEVLDFGSVVGGKKGVKHKQQSKNRVTLDRCSQRA